ncbi:hypothetical protein [Endozoicomonas sp. 8E]|nr:hypothetical protein [Endozoicomonas sp. 8E]WOG28264.1 hypothetical protein P6910_01035 [Endozoicomonas sp. 8E]
MTVYEKTHKDRIYKYSTTFSADGCLAVTVWNSATSVRVNLLIA